MAAMATILDNGTILTFMSLYATPMPPIKFPLNVTYGLGGYVVRGIV